MKGNVVELSVLIGVECGRGFVVPGGVVGAMTVLLMAFAAEFAAHGGLFPVISWS